MIKKLYWQVFIYDHVVIDYTSKELQYYDEIAYYYKAVNHFDPALTYLSERLRDNLILLNYQFKIQVPFFLSTSLPQTSLAAVLLCLLM